MPKADEIDQYDFEDSDLEEQLISIGKKLKALGAHPPSGKDALVKLLKRAAAALEEASQSSDSQRRACASVAAALAKEPVSGHKDKDVKTYTAFCLAHVLRLHTADCPYSASQQQGIFGLFMWVFRRLENANAPSFQMCHSILDVVSQTKCCLLMLDLDGAEDLVCDLFRLLFDVINEDNAEAISTSLLEIMACLIEEGDDVSQQLLDIVLAGLLDDNAPAARLAERLLQREEQMLRPYIQKYLVGVITGELVDTDLKGSVHDIIFKVYRATEQTLLPVLPHLAQQLGLEDEARRLAAVDLLGALFSIPGTRLDAEYAQLFAEFLRRFTDQKQAVRLAVIKYAPDIIKACTSASSRSQVLTGLVGRVMDCEEDVRIAAIEGITATAKHSLALLEGSLAPLDEVAKRLRDKKQNVRHTAAKQLLAVFWASCARSSDEASVSSDEESLAWIPGRLMLEASCDQVFGRTLLNGPFKDGIFPAKLSDAAAAHHWVAIYQALSTEQERSGVRWLLRMHSALQAEVGRLLDLRAARSGATPDAAEQIDEGLQRSVRKISSAFDNEAKAQEALHKLLEMKDNNIFKGLRAIVTPGATRNECRQAAKDVVQRVGSRGATGTMVASLCRRLTPSLLAPEHISELLSAAQRAKAEENDAYVAAMLQLLEDAAGYAPCLFAKHGAAISDLCAAGDPALAVTAARLLASAGRMLVEANDEAGDFPSEELRASLLDMCSRAPPKGAKAAVRAVVALYGRATAKVYLKEPVSRIVDSLRPPKTEAAGRQLAAGIAGAAMAVRLLPEEFAAQADALSGFVLGELTRCSEMTRGKGSTGLAQHELLHVPIGRTVLLQLAAVKAVVRMCEPAQQTAATPNGVQQSGVMPELIQRLVSELGILLNLGQDAPNDEAEMDPLLQPESGMDKAAVRFTAAAGLLRLARSHDDAVPVKIFHRLALTLQDPVLEVRRATAEKLHRTILRLQDRHPTRASKYASMLVMTGADPAEANQAAALRCLREFVHNRRRRGAQRAAANAAKRDGGGTVLHELPEFMLPTALHILAHHPDYPTPEAVEAEGVGLYDPFIRMLQFGLEPLVLAGDGAQPGAHLPVAATILRAVKRAQDASPEPRTERIHTLADLALQVAEAILDKAVPKRARGEGPPRSAPGETPLPTKFYRAGGGSAGRVKDGSHLPAGCEVQLDRLFTAQPVAPAKAPRARSKPTKRQAADGDAAAKPEPKRRAAKPKAAKKAKLTKIELDMLSSDEEGGSAQSSGSHAQASSGSEQQQQSGAKPPDTPSTSPPQPAEKPAKARTKQQPMKAAAGGRKPAGRKAAANGVKKKAKPTTPLSPRRQQPRRGAKATAEVNMKDATTSEDESAGDTS